MPRSIKQVSMSTGRRSWEHILQKVVASSSRTSSLFSSWKREARSFMVSFRSSSRSTYFGFLAAILANPLQAFSLKLFLQCLSTFSSASRTPASISFSTTLALLSIRLTTSLRQGAATIGLFDSLTMSTSFTNRLVSTTHFSSSLRAAQLFWMAQQQEVKVSSSSMCPSASSRHRGATALAPSSQTAFLEMQEMVQAAYCRMSFSWELDNRFKIIPKAPDQINLLQQKGKSQAMLLKKQRHCTSTSCLEDLSSSVKMEMQLWSMRYPHCDSFPAATFTNAQVDSNSSCGTSDFSAIEMNVSTAPSAMALSFKVSSTESSLLIPMAPSICSSSWSLFSFSTSTENSRFENLRWRS